MLTGEKKDGASNQPLLLPAVSLTSLLISEAGYAHVRELINEFPLGKSDIKYLQTLVTHAANIEILLERAKKRTHTGKRNKQGFREKGCNCRTCLNRVKGLEARLQAAKDKLEKERKRVTGEGHFDRSYGSIKVY